MRILVSGTTASVRRLQVRYGQYLGCLLTPDSGNSVTSIQKTGLPWAADNAAYSGLNEKKFRRMLRKIKAKSGCMFLSVPDVVGDAKATLEMFRFWRWECSESGQPLAFVGQDGSEETEIPWDMFDAWFIGGTTKWKLSQPSADLAQEALRRGKHVHMGRVNTNRRLVAAYDMGCHTVDGSGASRWGDIHLARMLRWVTKIHGQPTLF